LINRLAGWHLLAATACHRRQFSISVSPPHQTRRSLDPRGKTFGTIGALTLSESFSTATTATVSSLLKPVRSTVKMDGHAGTVLPRIPLLRFRPRERIKNLKFLFFTSQPTGRFQRGADFYPSPSRFHSMSARPAKRIYFAVNAFRYACAAES
jgi:hypothetical protein